MPLIRLSTIRVFGGVLLMHDSPNIFDKMLYHKIFSRSNTSHRRGFYIFLLITLFVITLAIPGWEQDSLLEKIFMLVIISILTFNTFLSYMLSKRKYKPE